MSELSLDNLTSVSIVMRTVGGRPREIRRAIASVAANIWRPLEVVVVYQGAESVDWDDIKKLPAEFPELQVKLLRNGAQGDRRAENLNIGWNAARGRFVGFLDDDDSLEPNHISILVDAIISTGQVWAYAQVVLRKEDEGLNVVSETKPFRRLQFSIKELWLENFLPIHSFLIDRSRLNESLCNSPFYEDLDRSEDWDFILRLAFWHEPAVVEEFTANYHVSTGTRNTNLSLMSVAEDSEREMRNKEAWDRCKLIVDARKSEMASMMWWAREIFSITPSASLLKVNNTAEGSNSSSIVTSSSLTIRQRILRKLIRVLERHL